MEQVLGRVREQWRNQENPDLLLLFGSYLYPVALFWRTRNSERDFQRGSEKSIVSQKRHGNVCHTWLNIWFSWPLGQRLFALLPEAPMCYETEKVPLPFSHHTRECGIPGQLPGLKDLTSNTPTSFPGLGMNLPDKEMCPLGSQ